MDNTNLIKGASMYKEALIGDYLKNFAKRIVKPIAKKGWGGGLGEIIGKQIMPQPYTAALKEKMIASRLNKIKLNQTMNSAKQSLSNIASGVTPGTAEDALKLKNILGDTSKEYAQAGIGINQLKQRMADYAQPGRIGKAFNILNPEPGASRVAKLKEMGNLAGHYLPQYLNTALMTGFPAYGLYHTLNAPYGEKSESLGRLIGENAAFLGLGPVGMLPALGGSLLGSHLGGKLGKAIGEKVAPTPWYKKVEKMLPIPQEEPYQGTIKSLGQDVQGTQPYQDLKNKYPNALPYMPLDLGFNDQNFGMANGQNQMYNI